MPDAKDLEKEVSELRAEVKRLTDRFDRKAWGNPHDIAYQALSFVDLVHHNYGGSTGQAAEKLGELVEMLRVMAVGRVSSPYAGAAFIYGLADLIEGAYLGHRCNEEVHRYANKRRIEEEQRAQREEKQSEGT